MIFNKSQSIPYYKYYRRSAASNFKMPYKFSHARTALKYGLKWFNIPEGSEILLPAFICDVVLQPFSQLGIKPMYYKVNRLLEPIWSDVEKKVSTHTKGIIMVHYFGIPQNIKTFQNFSIKHKILLIEDNAHGFGGEFNGRFLGTCGDISITSLRKCLPILNGAWLYIKKEMVNVDLPTKLEPKNIIYYQMREIAKWLIKGNSLLRRTFLKMPPYHDSEAFHEFFIPDWCMDDYTSRLIEKFDIGNIISLRQELYWIWEQWAKGTGLIPVFSGSIPSRCAPLAFPAYTSSVKERNDWFKWGFKNGFDVYSWPSLPVKVKNQDYSAMNYWNQLVCFPINLGMNPRKLKRLLQRFGKLSKGDDV